MFVDLGYFRNERSVIYITSHRPINSLVAHFFVEWFSCGLERKRRAHRTEELQQERSLLKIAIPLLLPDCWCIKYRSRRQRTRRRLYLSHSNSIPQVTSFGYHAHLIDRVQRNQGIVGLIIKYQVR